MEYDEIGSSSISDGTLIYSKIYTYREDRVTSQDAKKPVVWYNPKDNMVFTHFKTATKLNGVTTYIKLFNAPSIDLEDPREVWGGIACLISVNKTYDDYQKNTLLIDKIGKGSDYESIPTRFYRFDDSKIALENLQYFPDGLPALVSSPKWIDLKFLELKNNLLDYGIIVTDDMKIKRSF